MSLPGWYPDPAGTPNRFRYWDGRNWSSDTTDNPAVPPAAAGGPRGTSGDGGAGSPPPEGRRRFGPLILALAALVVLVLVGVLVVRGLFADRPIVDPGPLPSSTVSGWDDSSPTTEPETPTPTPSVSVPSPTPTPVPTPTEEQPLQPCPQGQPLARQDHPADGRVHGGGLSFPEARGWESSSGSAYSWAYDVGSQVKLAESPSWYSDLTVGALFTGDGFDEPRRSAELVMQCMITSGLYRNLVGRENTWSRAVTVDGRPAWSIRADVLVDYPDLTTKGDTVEVIVVDTGSPESLAMFVGAADIGDRSLQKTLDSAIKNLRVE
ncbi:MAG TPA: DUF2510 domain-containing protein [Microlunatus sp.]|nr:DUF2510 domain-containing protein [Microlunatus sp.]